MVCGRARSNAGTDGAKQGSEGGKKGSVIHVKTILMIACSSFPMQYVLQESPASRNMETVCTNTHTPPNPTKPDDRMAFV